MTPQAKGLQLGEVGFEVRPSSQANRKNMVRIPEGAARLPPVPADTQGFALLPSSNLIQGVEAMAQGNSVQATPRANTTVTEKYLRA